MRGVFFPLGDTHCDEDDREASLWRELSFAMHLVRQAVSPPLNLTECVENWREIAHDLAESPRERSYQMAALGKAI
jgi:hypothetical protein